MVIAKIFTAWVILVSGSSPLMLPVIAVKNVVFSEAAVKNVACSEPERDSLESNCEHLL